MIEGVPEQPPDSAAVPYHVGASQSVNTIVFAEDVRLVERLRKGDEAAFMWLIDRYHAAMLRLAMVYVPTRAVAEDVVQEAWLGILRGLERFEGRSSLKTWMFRILTNCAKTRAQREGRSIPFSSLSALDVDVDEPAVDPGRFRGPDQERPGSWVSFPVPWNDIPENRLLSQETRACIQRAVDALPPNQRTVITLHDIEGWTSEEVCRFIGISEANQRVLLHRARARVRRALEQYFNGEGVA
jgi:RNA polymerase sigma-70 factor (ECF subfamily)